MFNDKYGLTQAVLEGRKTQTRRIVPKEFFTLQWDVRDDTLVVENEFGEFVDIINTKYCMFKVGEIVAVAQSYNSFYNDEYNPVLFPSGAGWTNKMFVKPELMPYQIRITDVRVERLQDISDEDCLEEGIMKWDAGQKDIPFFSYPNSAKCDYDTPQEAFAHLINKVSGKGTWERNPYVFVYDFELVK